MTPEIKKLIEKIDNSELLNWGLWDEENQCIEVEPRQDLEFGDLSDVFKEFDLDEWADVDNLRYVNGNLMFSYTIDGVSFKRVTAERYALTWYTVYLYV